MSAFSETGRRKSQTWKNDVGASPRFTDEGRRGSRQPPRNDRQLIHIIVENGDVTLKGVVLNKLDRAKAETEARLAGTYFNLTNNLKIESKSDRMPALPPWSRWRPHSRGPAGGWASECGTRCRFLPTSLLAPRRLFEHCPPNNGQQAGLSESGSKLPHSQGTFEDRDMNLRPHSSAVSELVGHLGMKKSAPCHSKAAVRCCPKNRCGSV
jgi:hypothetical protein